MAITDREKKKKKRKVCIFREGSRGEEVCSFCKVSPMFRVIVSGTRPRGCKERVEKHDNKKKGFVELILKCLHMTTKFSI